MKSFEKESLQPSEEEKVSEEKPSEEKPEEVESEEKTKEEPEKQPKKTKRLMSEDELWTFYIEGKLDKATEEKLTEIAKASIELAKDRGGPYEMKRRLYEVAEKSLRKLGKLEKLAKAYEKEEKNDGVSQCAIEAAEIWTELGDKKRAKELYEKKIESIKRKLEYSVKNNEGTEYYRQMLRNAIQRIQRNADKLVEE